MIKQFEMQNLQALRVSAVDAYENPRPKEYAPHSWYDRWELSPSLIACFESHRMVWKAISEGKSAFGVVLEDDAILSTRFRASLASLKQIDVDFDIIKLDGMNHVRRFGPATNFNGNLLRSIKQSTPSAACYLLSKNGAKKLEKKSQQYCAHLDDYLFTPNRGWYPLQINTAIAVQGMFVEDNCENIGSSIFLSERTKDLKINRIPRKPPLQYRFYKEVKRFNRKLVWKVIADRKLLAKGGLIGCPDLADDLGPYLPRS